MARRYKHLEHFFIEYIEPILRFCSLYIGDDGYLYDNTYRTAYESAVNGKKFIFLKNYDIYKKFIENKDNYIPLNFINNKTHITLLMKFFRNAVFQRDYEFEDYFYSYQVDPNTNEVFAHEITRSAEEITEEATKHIELLRTARDYNGNVRYRWCIKTNLKNQLINKPLTESILPDNYSINIAMLLSMLNCIEYYRYGDRALFLSDVISLQQANNLIQLSSDISKELKFYNNKFQKSKAQEMYEKTDYLFNVEMNENNAKTGNVAIDSGILPMDIGGKFDL